MGAASWLSFVLFLAWRLVHRGHGLELRKTALSQGKGWARDSRGETASWATSLEAARALAGDGRADRQRPRLKGQQGSAGDPLRVAKGLGGASAALSTNAASNSYTVEVSINKGRYSISPLVFGVNEYHNPNWTAFRDAGIGLVRKGGNAESRYNWAVDANNRAADWFFQSLPNSWPGQASVFDQMVEANKATGIHTVATIPVLEWLPKAQKRGCSFSIKKYGQQKRQAPDLTDCGDGMLPNGQRIRNDPSDVSVKTDASHQAAWVQSLVQKYGSAKKGGVRYYCLDNEPVWWSYNHWDIHPNPSNYSEIVQRSLTFAPAIKKADPTAQILGPVTGGWSDTFFSIKDMQAGWSTRPYKYWSNPVDRKAHGNKPFLQYYLEQMKAYEERTGTRIIDVVDIHAYVVNVNDNTDPSSQAERIEGVRVLWDANFTCSFCDWVDPITAPDGVPRFISRVKEIIRSTYRGLRLAVTEYNFGGTRDISGAIAQAEALGVFAKTGVAMATVFPNPDPSTTVYMAFKMFGNYDGKKSMFGRAGVQAVSSSRHDISPYAAIDARTNRLTILVINLKPTQASVSVNITDFKPRRKLSVYRYSAANLRQIVGLPSISPSSTITMDYPGYSLTMLVVPLFA